MFLCEDDTSISRFKSPLVYYLRKAPGITRFWWHNKLHRQHSECIEQSIYFCICILVHFFHHLFIFFYLSKACRNEFEWSSSLRTKWCCLIMKVKVVNGMLSPCVLKFWEVVVLKMCILSMHLSERSVYHVGLQSALVVKWLKWLH